eukprot:8762270-Karenia_brevis.AAC.1
MAAEWANDDAAAIFLVDVKESSPMYGMRMLVRIKPPLKHFPVKLVLGPVEGRVLGSDQQFVNLRWRADPELIGELVTVLDEDVVTDWKLGDLIKEFEYNFAE